MNKIDTLKLPKGWIFLITVLISTTLFFLCVINLLTSGIIYRFTESYSEMEWDTSTQEIIYSNGTIMSVPMPYIDRLASVIECKYFNDYSITYSIKNSLDTVSLSVYNILTFYPVVSFEVQSSISKVEEMINYYDNSTTFYIIISNKLTGTWLKYESSNLKVIENIKMVLQQYIKLNRNTLIQHTDDEYKEYLLVNKVLKRVD